ncbi:MAG: type II toxin-antitoxin system RatA family toxin [Rhodospirillaceae bacterium]
MPTHAEKKFLPYTPDQMYRLVADIDRYPEFLPWCIGARVKSRTGNIIKADLMIGFKMVRERFTSTVILTPPARIDVKFAEGPFQHLTNHWIFEHAPGGCLIDFYVDFEFKSKMLQKVIAVLFGEAVRRMVVAFEGRAAALYNERSDKPAA